MAYSVQGYPLTYWKLEKFKEKLIATHLIAVVEAHHHGLTCEPVKNIWSDALSFPRLFLCRISTSVNGKQLSGSSKQYSLRCCPWKRTLDWRTHVWENDISCWSDGVPRRWRETASAFKSDSENQNAERVKEPQSLDKTSDYYSPNLLMPVETLLIKSEII